MNFIPLKIPVKPHVKAWLDFHFPGYVLSRNDFIGIMLYHILKKQRNQYNKNDHITLKDYTEKWEVDISAFNFFDLGCNQLSVESIVHFNKMINAQMNFMFQATVRKKMEAPAKTKREAILQFMDENGINEEQLTEDAFLKSYQRFRKHGENIRMGMFN